MDIDFPPFASAKEAFETAIGGKEIPQLSLVEAMDLAEALDVKGFMDAQNLTDLQKCLKIHLLQINNMRRQGREPLKVFTKLKTVYETNCKKLAEIIDDCVNILQKLSDNDPLLQDLCRSFRAIDKKFKFPQTLLEHRNNLLKSEQRILVLGELCAGKTSLVNVVLEEEALPANFLSNTHTLSELKYCPYHGAIVHPWEEEGSAEKKAKIIVTDNEEFLRYLHANGEIEYCPSFLNDSSFELSDEGNQSPTKDEVSSQHAESSVSEGTNQQTCPGCGDQTDSSSDNQDHSYSSISKDFETIEPREAQPKPEIQIVKSEVFKQTVSHYIEQKDETSTVETKGKNMKVELFLPNDLLKDGLTIIDSPGVGDSPKLTEVVIENLVNAFGFIYVINSRNRGGVQEDRVSVLLEKVRNLQSVDNQKLFCPESAIFVCNQWDKISASEHDRLLEDTIRKLEKCWSGLQPEQVIPFSAAEAKEMYEEGYLTREFKNLLDGIESLIPVGLENKIYISFRYLVSFIKRLIMQLDGYLNHLQTGDEDRKKKFKGLKERLNGLKGLTTKEFKHLRKQVDLKLKDASEQLKEHLMTDEIKAQIISWKVEDAPTFFSSYDEVERFIKKTVISRICTAIGSWNEKNKYFDEVPVTISEQFNKFFQSLSDQMQDIQDRISTCEITVSGDKLPLKKKDRLDLNPLLMFEKIHTVVKSPAQKIAAGLLVPVAIPIFLAASVPALVIAGGIAAVDKWKSKEKADAFLEYLNPRTRTLYLQKHSRNILENYCASTDLYQHIQALLKPAYDLVSELEQSIPGLINADQEQVESLIRDKRNNEDLMKFYPTLRETMLDFRKRIHHYQVLYMKRNSRDIEVHNFCDSTVMDDAKVCSGWFTDILKAQISEQKGHSRYTERVCLRRFNRPIKEMDISHYLEEERCWSNHTERNIAKFKGLTVEDLEGRKVMYHILEPLTGSLRLKITSMMESETPNDHRNEFIKDVCSQVARGLHFLHSRQFVHLDLTLDTVATTMCDQSLVVKLTNISLSREVPLPSKINKEDLMQYVYLPFEVLDGQMYTQKSDIYSLGLLLWEMVTGHKVFTEVIKAEVNQVDTLEKFKNYVKDGRPNVNTFKSLDGLEEFEFDQTWQNLILLCLDSEPRRISIKDFIKGLKNPDDIRELTIKTDHFEKVSKVHHDMRARKS